MSVLCAVQSFIRRVLALRRVRVLRGEREAVVLVKKGKAATVIQCRVRQRLAVKKVRPFSKTNMFGLADSWWICSNGDATTVGSPRLISSLKRTLIYVFSLYRRWSTCCWAVTRRPRRW